MIRFFVTIYLLVNISQYILHLRSQSFYFKQTGIFYESRNQVCALAQWVQPYQSPKKVSLQIWSELKFTIGWIHEEMEWSVQENWFRPHKELLWIQIQRYLSDAQTEARLTDSFGLDPLQPITSNTMGNILQYNALTISWNFSRSLKLIYMLEFFYSAYSHLWMVLFTVYIHKRGEKVALELPSNWSIPRLESWIYFGRLTHL